MKKYGRFFLLFVTGFVIILSCSKDSVKTLSLTTLDISGNTPNNFTRANTGGNITSEGGASITARGVCWGTSAKPTLADNKTIDGAGLGVFTSKITGLEKATMYFVRAYATNANGTEFGNELNFTTPDCKSWGSLTGSTLTFDWSKPLQPQFDKVSHLLTGTWELYRSDQSVTSGGPGLYTTEIITQYFCTTRSRVVFDSLSSRSISASTTNSSYLLGTLNLSMRDDGKHYNTWYYIVQEHYSDIATFYYVKVD